MCDSLGTLSVGGRKAEQERESGKGLILVIDDFVFRERAKLWFFRNP